MRVLFVSDVYFPRVNGVSTSIRTFRDDLAALDIETTLVAPRYPGDGAESRPGIVRVDSWRVPRDPEDRFMPWPLLQQALRSIRDQTFDLVHIHTPFAAHYAGVKFARAAGIPAVATYHTLFAEYLHHYLPVLPRRASQRLARYVTRSQCAQVSALIAPSQPMRELLLEYGVRTPIHVLPTGLSAACYRPGDGAGFRVAHNIPAEQPLLLYVGRVAHEKNIDFLLQMLVVLRNTRPDALLLIAGEGPALAHLARLTAELGLSSMVKFIGYLDREQGLRDCYAAAQVFVFASRTETQGLVLLEAMAQGTPVVSTACMGTKSILLPGCGAEVVPEETAAFAQAVLKLLADPARRARAAVETRQAARSWSSIVMAQRMAELYQQVCAVRVRPSLLVQPAT